MNDLFPDIGGGAVLPAQGERPGAAPRTTWRGVAAVAAGAVLIALAVFAVRHLVADTRPPARQIAKIALLPDTPPPPPPKIEKKEEIKQAKPVQQQEMKPKEQAPAPAPLKMEGAAGNGPSAFQAGTVTQDYKGGVPVVGGAASQASGLERAQARLYANSVRQALHDELERQLPPEATEIDARIALWIAGDGRISHWEVEGPPPAQEPELKSAMARVSDALTLPAPQAVPQPLRFHLSLRAG